jgi:C4-dicarboxylate transporter DctM subunit
VIMTELALISPPVGMNLFVLQSIRKQADGPAGSASMTDVFVGVLPFMILQGIILILLLIFPQMALWLPAVLKQ